MRGPKVAAAALTMLVPLLAGCGGGGSKAAQPLPKAPTLTVPGDKSNPSVPKLGTTGATGPGTSTAATTNTLPATTTQANPSTPQGGAAPPSTGGASPDTQQNNTSPPAGSPAQKFEQFCKDNPGAC